MSAYLIARIDVTDPERYEGYKALAHAAVHAHGGSYVVRGGDHETIEGAPGLADEHLSVFDCAFRPVSGSRSIDWMGHVRMMGAVQPFLSGAISKTVNLPEDATAEDIMRAYSDILAERLGQE